MQRLVPGHCGEGGFCFFFFQLIDNVVLTSAVQQRGPVIRTRIFFFANSSPSCSVAKDWPRLPVPQVGYRRDLSILGVWCPGGSWSQCPQSLRLPVHHYSYAVKKKTRSSLRVDSVSFILIERKFRLRVHTDFCHVAHNTQKESIGRIYW